MLEGCGYGRGRCATLVLHRFRFLSADAGGWSARPLGPSSAEPRLVTDYFSCGTIRQCNFRSEPLRVCRRLRTLVPARNAPRIFRAAMAWALLVSIASLPYPWIYSGPIGSASLRLAMKASNSSSIASSKGGAL